MFVGRGFLLLRPCASMYFFRSVSRYSKTKYSSGFPFLSMCSTHSSLHQRHRKTRGKCHPGSKFLCRIFLSKADLLINWAEEMADKKASRSATAWTPFSDDHTSTISMHRGSYFWSDQHAIVHVWSSRQLDSCPLSVCSRQSEISSEVQRPTSQCRYSETASARGRFHATLY